MTPRTTTTAADGGYLFDLLSPGTYEVTVTASGFQSVNETGIVITAGFTATINSKLQVGQVTQTIQVEGEPVVDLQSVQTSTTFDQSLLQDIPSGRDPWSTVAQMPGVDRQTREDTFLRFAIVGGWRSLAKASGALGADFSDYKVRIVLHAARAAKRLVQFEVHGLGF